MMTHDKNRELVLSRLFNASPEQVYSAWTTQEQVEKWWGPRGFTNLFRRFEVKVGGVWEYTMRGPDGTDYPNWVRFEQVIANKKLVFQHGSTPDDPNLFQVTVTFEAEGQQTRVRMTHVFSSQAERDMVVQTYHAIEAGHQTLDKMGEFVARSLYRPDLILIRHFQAPLITLFDIWSDLTNLKSKLTQMSAQIDKVEKPHLLVITAKTLDQKRDSAIAAQVDLRFSKQQELSVVEVRGQIHSRGQEGNSEIEERFYQQLEQWVLESAQKSQQG